MRVAAMAVLLAGCDAAFGLDTTRLIDAPACLPVTSSFDTFDQDTTTPCGWGYLTQTSCTAIATGGDLVMTPTAGASNAICVCSAATPMTFTSMFGTMVQVDELPTQAGEYSQFIASSSGISWIIEYGPAGMISFARDKTRLGSVPWDASSRWWRIRPNDAGTAVIGEASGDGITWSMIAMDPSAPPATVKSDFSTGTFQSLSAPTSSRLASINVCP
ncbi:MAG TPA: hypothetical protein VGM90_34350 [Kofleriaceae bacterium]|jgi:hypothetical protein